MRIKFTGMSQGIAMRRQTETAYQVALPKTPGEIPTDIPPLGVVGISRGSS